MPAIAPSMPAPGSSMSQPVPSVIHVATRYLVVTGIAVIALNLYAPGDPTARERTLASLIIVLGGLPVAAWIFGGRSGIPFLPAIGVVYAMYFGAPVLILRDLVNSTNGYFIVPPEALERALGLAAIGISFLYFGYAVGGSFFRHLKEKRTAWTDSNAPLLGGVIGTLGLVVYFYNLSEEFAVGFGQALTLGSSLSVLGATILFAAWKQGTLSRGGWVYLWLVLVPIRVLAGFGTGANYQGFEIFLCFGLCAAAITKKLPWKGALVLLTILVLLQPVKGVFRERVLERSGEYKNPVANSKEFLSTAKEVIGETSVADAVEAYFSRVGYIYTFAQTVDATPARIPYWDGESYASLGGKLLPRILFPNKGEDDIGQSFGHRYGLITAEDTGTSINCAQLIEFYINYGLPGVLIGMFLVGLIFRLLKQLLGASSGDVGSAVIAAYVLSPMLLIENNLSSVFAGTAYRLVFGLVLGRVIRVIGGSLIYPGKSEEPPTPPVASPALGST